MFLTVVYFWLAFLSVVGCLPLGEGKSLRWGKVESVVSISILTRRKRTGINHSTSAGVPVGDLSDWVIVCT